MASPPPPQPLPSHLPSRSSSPDLLPALPLPTAMQVEKLTAGLREFQRLARSSLLTGPRRLIYQDRMVNRSSVLAYHRPDATVHLEAIATLWPQLKPVVDTDVEARLDGYKDPSDILWTGMVTFYEIAGEVDWEADAKANRLDELPVS